MLAVEAAARVQRAEDALVTAARAFTERLRGVVLARLRGPKARRGTRYWSDGVKSADPTGDVGGSGTRSHPGEGRTTGYETKALDGDYIVPDRLIEEIDDALRPVALRVAMDAATDTASRLVPEGNPLGDETDAMFAVDTDLLGSLIDNALDGMLGTAASMATEVREAILDADSDGLEFDALLDVVEQTLDRTSRWIELNARTTATALAGKATLEQARLLGVTHVQWLSRRDDRVRPTHVIADGQVRAIGEDFRVGRHELEHPGDPSGLPTTAEEVYGCRCGLLFAPPDRRVGEALMATARSALGDDGGSVESALAAAAAAAQFAPQQPSTPADVALPTDVVGWRVLTAEMDVRAGQLLELPAGTELGLAPPAQRTAATLSVLVPAGTRVGIGAAGTLVLLAAASVHVLSVSSDGLQTALF